jgi:transcriptional regulator with GAF, ATPase, and Fis domain
VASLRDLQTETFRGILSAHGIPCQPLLALSQDAIFDVLESRERACGWQASDSENQTTPGWEEPLIGQSAAMLRIKEVIRLVAKRTCTVLIGGESGTGKEVVARALHLASDRSRREMVSVNCAAVPATLLESEMFGHEKGAFTGATATRIGRFEQAHQSTIFLDEIGDMPLELQAKILRVLQEREFHRIGRTSPIRVETRVIAATNRDLEQEMASGRFRQDLYFRLRVIPLHIPPLRERTEDIPTLVDHFVEKVCRREGLGAKGLAPGVSEHLAEQSWPGNVRELEHCIERAVALSGERETLDLRDFPPFCDLVPSLAPLHPDVPGNTIDLAGIVGRLEKALIDLALQRSRGNKALAAQMLGLKRSTLVSKVKALQMCA